MVYGKGYVGKNGSKKSVGKTTGSNVQSLRSATEMKLVKDKMSDMKSKAMSLGGSKALSASTLDAARNKMIDEMSKRGTGVVVTKKTVPGKAMADARGAAMNKKMDEMKMASAKKVTGPKRTGMGLSRATRPV